jgi:hypothetical protein
MRKFGLLFIALAILVTGIAAADLAKDFRYTAVEFVPVDIGDPLDPADDVILPAVLGDLLPDTDADTLYEVRYVVQKKTGWVVSTNPGQLYGVITIDNTEETTFVVEDSFGTQFDINPAHLGGGVEVIRVDAAGYATVLTETTQVVSATVDNEANTVSLDLEIETPLGTGESLMIYCKYQAVKGVEADMNPFTNNVLVNDVPVSATIEFA